MTSLADLGEVSKALEQDISKVNVRGGAKKIRGAAGEAVERLGRRVGEKLTQPGREYAERLNRGVDEGMTGTGSMIGEAIGNQIKTKVGEANRRLIRNTLIAGAAGTAGVAGTYDIARRREHRRRQEGMLMEASLNQRRKRAWRRA